MNRSGLTSEAFWEDEYLAQVQLPSRPDPHFQFDAVLSAALAKHAPVAAGGSVLEVGCAPATWLGFYAERFGASVTGIEYTAFGAELSRRNLLELGVTGKILHQDFFAAHPQPYDLVVSLGFIEHFEDLEGTLNSHVAFLAPGGLLALGVPNYRGVMGLLQRVGDPAHLAMHNTKAMDAGLWRGLAEARGLELMWQGYLDGPDPAMLSVRRRWFMPVVVLLEMLRRSGLGKRLNHRWTSAYLLTVVRRPR